MKVKFKDGTVVDCSTPTEQKVFRAGEAAGWILSFALIGNITSAEVDKLLVPENISDLIFTSEDELGNEYTISLSGYGKISSAVIRYTGEGENIARVEIQLTKGI